MEVIERVCRERGARLVKAGEDFSWQAGSFDEGGQSFRLKGLRREYDLRIPLLGAHQVENAAGAATAAELLAEKDKKITAAAISNGLQKVDWPGRLQVLRHNPRVVIDGAHNVYSMQKLAEALKDYFKYDKLILILGFSADKDVNGMIAEAIKMTGDIILAPSRNPRSVKPAALLEDFSGRGVKARAAGSVTEALELAGRRPTTYPPPVIFVMPRFGSVGGKPNKHPLPRHHDGYATKSW
jgi:dihydrofolate synthase/folylpolyglutamate synthase